MFKHKKNKELGITLIALIVTIIVLLILAGVTIASLIGDNDLLSRAVEAKQNSEKAEIIEKARIEIMAKIAEKEGQDLNSDDVKEILDDYFNNVPNDITDQTQTITTKTNGYNVKLSEVLTGVEIGGADVGYEVRFVIDFNNSSYYRHLEVYDRWQGNKWL